MLQINSFHVHHISSSKNGNVLLMGLLEKPELQPNAVIDLIASELRSNYMILDHQKALGMSDQKLNLESDTHLNHLGDDLIEIDLKSNQLTSDLINEIKGKTFPIYIL